MKLETTEYKGWKNCLRLSNGHVELVMTLDVGPRIISYALKGGRNVFKNYEEMMGKTSGDEWFIFGGHRLWHAPEDEVRTYSMDFDPVEHEWNGVSLTLRQRVESLTGIRKEMEITLDPDSCGVRVVHRLYNQTLWDVELAPWCLSVMDKGARAIVPQEPYGEHPIHMLPARPLVLWPFTDMADPRWTWGTRYLQLQQDPKRETPQKAGVFNSHGWAACAVNGAVFIVKYPVNKGKPHADMGSNTELFTNGDMLEVETLGPLSKLVPGGKVEHVESWGLFAATPGPSESDLDAILPKMLGQVANAV